MEDVYYNSSNIKMVLENFKKFQFIRSGNIVRKQFANVGFWEVPVKVDYIVHI
jgi:hypothetical protein